MNTSALCHLRIMPRRDTLPDETLVARINADARRRCATFESERRRCDFLWNRVLLTQLLAEIDPDARLIEQPPYSPRIEAARPLYCTISHTASFVAVGVSDQPIAIDVEMTNKRRAVHALWSRVFNEALWENTPEAERKARFYAYWGLYECAVKLQGECRHTDRDVRVVLDGRPLAHCHRRLDAATLLTVVGNGVPALQLDIV